MAPICGSCLPRALVVKPLLLLLLCIWSATSLQSVQSNVQVYKWDISYQLKSPDCFQKLAVTINGETPGPTIKARQGDTIEVHVKNGLLTENVAIHWHGIRQIGTPWADGTKGVTQCPILPGETFVKNRKRRGANGHVHHA